ncbi:MAG: PEP-utilizing enzyme [Candidatus Micrarchaeota archaeon]|nr:PEP-utilizing enzyme [Candidatus Micrarchaeota archaeon]
MDLNAVAKVEWIVHWSGGWSLLSCSYFGHQYTETIARDLGISIKDAVLTSSDGHSACYFPRKEVDAFGNALAKKVLRDKKQARIWCSDLKQRTDRITNVMAKLKSTEMTPGLFNDFIPALYDYVPPHIAVKKVVDYLPPEVLQELLPQFTKARVYAEKVYTDSEKTMQLFSQWVSKQSGVKPQLVLCMVKEEVDKYFETSKLPNTNVLQGRFENSALVFHNGSRELFVGSKAKEFEVALHAGDAKETLSGKTAFPGKAKGTVRIVLDAKNPGVFNEGDILVTGMTRPEYLQLFKKAAAVVTDAGGVLSHAAITARELKKPCVIGTLKATKLLKSGDVVEVDADKGIIRQVK